jgi:hypothetical protein
LPFRTAASLIALVAVVSMHSSRADAATRFYVSPSGSDRDPGTLRRPFRTLDRAGVAVRSVNRHMTAAIQVRLLGGTYRMRTALVLTARDSGRRGHPVVWMAQPGQAPVLSGAIRVRRWSRFDARQGIWRARVPRRLASRQLYVDGVRATRARSERPLAGYRKTARGYVAPDARMASWPDRRGAELVSNWGWKHFRCPVAAVTGRQVTMRQPCWSDANVFAETFSMGVPDWIENAYELLDRPGEWYLDSARGWLYYKPAAGRSPARADVELPVATALVIGRGTLGRPIHDLRFEGITFAYATWLVPSTPTGYADDQTGLRVVGFGQPPAQSHALNTVPTPGNVAFAFARRITFLRDRFVHLGAAGVQLGTGSQHGRILDSRFRDLSAAAVVLGGVAIRDHHPRHRGQVTRDNQVSNNVVSATGREYLDAAGIFVGYTTRSLVSHNDLHDLPYTGIAVGWGFGMTDPGRFPGCFGCAPPNLRDWPTYRTPTTSRGNRVLDNRVWNYLRKLYDGGAVYVLGQQGASARDGMVIAGNVAFGKRSRHGGNVLYTDAGTRYMTIRGNATFGNAPGYYGPTPPLSLVQWGRDGGGCRPRGAIRWQGNWWQYPDVGYPQPQLVCHPPYCPLGVTFAGNRLVRRLGDIPPALLARAGVQGPARTAVAYPPVAGTSSTPANPPPPAADCPHQPF